MPLWLLTSLLGAGNRIKTASRWLFGSWVHALAGALALSLAWGWIGWHGKAAAINWGDAEHAARLAQAEAVKAATARNIALQAAQDADTARVQAERNRRTDDVVKAAETARVDAVQLYADAHRVRPDAVRCSTASAAVLSGDPGKPDDSAAQPDLVAISRPDLDGLTSDAVQGAARWRYLQALVDSGVAVVGD